MSRAKIIEIATADLGYKEESFLPGEKWTAAGTNRTKFGKHFKMDGQPWCFMAVSMWYELAGHALPPINTPQGGTYVPTGFNYWAAHHNFTLSPLPADIVLFDWQKGKPDETAQEKLSDHIGIFLEWIDKKSGTFYTIEGNTSVGNDSNGGEVMKRMRNMAFVSAFVNPLSLPA